MTPSTSDTVTIAAATDGVLNVTTVDNAGTAADINFVADGQIEYRANDAAGHIFDINGTNQLAIIDGMVQPVTDNDIDLGSQAKSFKDAHIQGTASIGTLAGLAGGIQMTGSLIAPKLNQDLTDAHGGLVMNGLGVLSIGHQKKVFMRAASANAAAMTSDYLTASLGNTPMSGTLSVYLNGVLLNGLRVDKTGITGKPPGNHLNMDYRELRTRGAGGSPLSSSVFLHPNLAMDADDVLQCIYLSGSDIPASS